MTAMPENGTGPAKIALSASSVAGAAIYRNRWFAMWPDRIVEATEHGNAVAHAASKAKIISTCPDATRTQWRSSDHLFSYPQVESEFDLLDALHLLALEELDQDSAGDGTFQTGALWQGVWTRDVSYSILLSLAAIAPERARESLMHRVQNGRIVQDTGTGGGWPVSSDRLIWIAAAWEMFLVGGDRDWLCNAFRIAKVSIQEDFHATYDPSTGLIRGESSFLDWREQTYPKWMDAVDIYHSECLSTNAIFYRALRILGLMAEEMGELADPWNKRAEQVLAAIQNYLWLPDRGHFAAYRYGRLSCTPSTRWDALGHALAILFDVATPSQADAILTAQPLLEIGIPTVYPQAPGIPPYHNDSVWPFVQTFWNLAAAKRGNTAVLLHGIACGSRASALFLSNKENFVASTGSSSGTVLNSDRQLWSVAGSLATSVRIFFGLHFERNGLHIHPTIPRQLGGTRTLKNLRYRQSTLTLQVRGFGTKIRSCSLDGATCKPIVPPHLTGEHRMVIIMDENLPDEQKSLQSNCFAPETPSVSGDNAQLVWDAVPGAKEYRVFEDGTLLLSTFETSIRLSGAYTLEYQVSAVDASGSESYLSCPVRLRQSMRYAPHGNDGGEPLFVELDEESSQQASFTFSSPENTYYHFQFEYSNGSGPLNTGNGCARRTLFVDGGEIGVIVFPQRGQDTWNQYGLSSSHTVMLSEGKHLVELLLTEEDIRRDAGENRVRIAALLVLMREQHPKWGIQGGTAHNT